MEHSAAFTKCMACSYTEKGSHYLFRNLSKISLQKLFLSIRQQLSEGQTTYMSKLKAYINVWKIKAFKYVRCSGSVTSRSRKARCKSCSISRCAQVAPLSVRLHMKINHESSCWETPKTKINPNEIRDQFNYFFFSFKWKFFMKWFLISIFTKQFKWVPSKQHAGLALHNWCPRVEQNPEWGLLGVALWCWAWQFMTAG